MYSSWTSDEPKQSLQYLEFVRIAGILFSMAVAAEEAVATRTEKIGCKSASDSKFYQIILTNKTNEEVMQIRHHSKLNFRLFHTLIH